MTPQRCASCSLAIEVWRRVFFFRRRFAEGTLLGRSFGTAQIERTCTYIYIFTYIHVCVKNAHSASVPSYNLVYSIISVNVWLVYSYTYTCVFKESPPLLQYFSSSWSFDTHIECIRMHIYVCACVCVCVYEKCPPSSSTFLYSSSSLFPDSSTSLHSFSASPSRSHEARS